MASSSEDFTYSDALFLLASDTTDTVLTNVVLNGKNFEAWKSEMRNELLKKNKLSIIEGSRIEPDDSRYGEWLHCNQLVISWILNTVSAEIRSTLLDFNTGAELWKNLRCRFEEEASVPLKKETQSVEEVEKKVGEEVKEIKKEAKKEIIEEIKKETDINEKVKKAEEEAVPEVVPAEASYLGPFNPPEDDDAAWLEYVKEYFRQVDNEVLIEEVVKDPKTKFV